MEKLLNDKIVELVILNSSDKTISITDNTDLVTDLFFDSISIIKLVIDLEKEFNIEFPNELLLLEKIRLFSSLRNIVISCIDGEI